MRHLALAAAAAVALVAFTGSAVSAADETEHITRTVKLDPVEAHSFSGSVEIHERTWAPDRSVDVHTFNGNVDVHVPDTAQANVTFNSFSGRLDSALPLLLSSSSRRALRARLGSAGSGSGDLTFKTFSGNVTIGR